MAVRAALIHINKAIDDHFSEAEGDMDADTRFCIGWFQQYEFAEGPFGKPTYWLAQRERLSMASAMQESSTRAKGKFGCSA